MFEILHHRVDSDEIAPQFNMRKIILRPNRRLTTEAACAGLPVDMFFMEIGEMVSDKHLKPFRTLCSNCPVVDICLEWAVVHEKYGFWGGTTERERKSIRRKNHLVCSDIHAQDLY